jgi:predicted DNA-binding protein (MmcQ/YjbR family)
MTTKRELIDYCLTYTAVYEDYPFDETTALVRHMGNKKMFALVDYLHGRLHITLKCEPFRADFFRQAYESVVPGYHMNKEHWNTVYIDLGDIPADVLNGMIQHSYDLTKPKGKMKRPTNK